MFADFKHRNPTVVNAEEKEIAVGPNMGVGDGFVEAQILVDIPLVGDARFCRLANVNSNQQT